MKKRLCYGVMCLICLGIEILIGSFLYSGFIRSYMGDVLVLPVLYFLIRTIWSRDNRWTQLWLPAGLFLVGVVTELLQAANFTERLGIDPGSLSGILLGSVYDWRDLVCYAAGTALIYGYLLSEQQFLHRKEER